MSCSISNENNAILTCFSSKYLSSQLLYLKKYCWGSLIKGDLSILPVVMYGFSFFLNLHLLVIPHTKSMTFLENASVPLLCSCRIPPKPSDLFLEVGAERSGIGSLREKKKWLQSAAAPPYLHEWVFILLVHLI